MILPVLALGLLATVLAQSYQQGPMQSYPPQTSHIIYFPPKYNGAPNANVPGGRDYGSFEDVFDGPSQKYSSSYPPQYPPPYGTWYGGNGGYGVPQYPWYPANPPLSNPFYVGPRNQRRRRCRYNDRDRRKLCKGWNNSPIYNYPDTWYENDSWERR